jgi:hypothetical protein
MTFSYAIRKLGSLPWPSSLGKDIEFPGMREKLRAVLGDSYADPAAHRDALHNNPDCRAVVEIALESADWAADLVDGVDRATELARDAPLLGQVLDDVTPWRQWAAPYRELYRRSVWDWLYRPVKVFWNGISDDGIA